MRFLSGLLLSLIFLSGCPGAAPVIEEEHPCKIENHCMLVDGDSRCENGYEWENISDSSNYNCILSEQESQTDAGVSNPCQGNLQWIDGECQCPEGWVETTPNLCEEDLCPPNSSLSGPGNCTCDYGYMVNEARNDCIECVDNSTPATAGGCACNAGYTFDEDTWQCEAICPENSTFDGVNTCTCDEGHFGFGAGAEWACYACPEGSTPTEEGGCDCGDQHYLSGETLECERICPENATFDGVETCICGEGFFPKGAGEDWTCNPCPEGSTHIDGGGCDCGDQAYLNYETMVCTNYCPENSTTTNDGATCDCGEGYYANDDLYECVPCPENAWAYPGGGCLCNDGYRDEDTSNEVLVCEAYLSFEGESCAFYPGYYGQSDCMDGLICTPPGVCRLDCSAPAGSNTLIEDPDICDTPNSQLTCQTLLPMDSDQLEFLDMEEDQLGDFAMACMPQTTDLSSPCYALHDDDACTENRQCEIAAYERVIDEVSDDLLYEQYEELRCRDTCDPDGEGVPAGVCTGDDLCLWSQDPISGDEVLWQGDDPGTSQIEWMACPKTQCANNEISCPCTGDNQCLPTTDGFAHCGIIDHAGWCGAPVDLLTVEDWDLAMGDEGNLPADKLCEEVSDLRLCDDRPYRDSHVTAYLNCVGMNTAGTIRTCMAFCHIPADPGNVNSEEFMGQCPDGLECAPDLGLALPHGRWMGNTGFVDYQWEAEVCEAVQCPEGELCDSCTHPHSYCKSTDNGSNCFSPFSLCQEPPPVPPHDGGVTEPTNDAGPNVDAGQSMMDSGNTQPPVDAGNVGNTVDSGPTGATGESMDSGTSTAADAGGSTEATAVDAGPLSTQMDAGN